MGGAGTLLEVLRCKASPSVLAIPNAALMDDHQRELAQTLSEENYLTMGSPVLIILDPAFSTMRAAGWTGLKERAANDISTLPNNEFLRCEKMSGTLYTPLASKMM